MKMMRLVRTGLAVMIGVAVLLGWVAESYDVFLFTMLIGCGLVFLTALTIGTIKYYHLKPLRDRYKNKPYQLQLLGMTVRQDEPQKLKPMDRTSPYWGSKK